MLKYSLYFCLIAFIISACQPEKKAPDQVYPLIPLPESVTYGDNVLMLEGVLAVSGPDPIISTLQPYFEKEGIVLNLSEETEAAVKLELTDINSLNEEGYDLKVNDQGVQIKAASPAGLFYGMQTLRQLATQVGETIEIPYVHISDSPRFSWRGMHLDVCRHFFSVEEVKQYLDYLAMHKFNRFHWHLTEDQGWRIEIKKYPKLTQHAAWRDSTIVGHLGDKPRTYDTTRYGGFYTQDEIREVVDYAQARFITVVPEIEMPGHAQAAVSAYPELGVTGAPVGVKTEWGISPYIYNVEESTFDFLKNVLLEVMELFPGPYIHIGGDEAIKDQWEASQKVQQKIRQLGLANEAELQSWFIQRMDSFLTRHDKILIGWDEILEGGLSPNAVVMSWRGTEGGIEAAESGHDAIMSPTSHSYFDYYQSENREDEPLAIGGYLPVDSVYHFEPVPPELDQGEANHILGAQANVWTEYIEDMDHVEYMIFPRMLALAEVVWTPKPKKNFEGFTKRLEAYRVTLDSWDIHYATHVFE